MSKRVSRPVSMTVTVYFRDALKDAITAIHRRFPHHTITHFEELGHADMMRELEENGNWYGHFVNWPLLWLFVVEKQQPEKPGPCRAEVRIHPMTDVIFSDSHDSMLVEVAFDDGPTTIKVAGIDSVAVDAFVRYNPDGDLWQLASSQPLDWSAGEAAAPCLAPHSSTGQNSTGIWRKRQKADSMAPETDAFLPSTGQWDSLRRNIQQSAFGG
jgi:hypothetical protein